MSRGAIRIPQYVWLGSQDERNCKTVKGAVSRIYRYISGTQREQRHRERMTLHRMQGMRREQLTLVQEVNGKLCCKIVQEMTKRGAQLIFSYSFNHCAAFSPRGTPNLTLAVPTMQWKHLVSASCIKSGAVWLELPLSPEPYTTPLTGPRA